MCSLVHKYQQFWRKPLPPSFHRRGVYSEDNNRKLLPNVVPIHQTTWCHKPEGQHLRVSTEYTVLAISTDSHY